MLFVSRIKLRNFKSFRFADIPLPKGVICIAGPNGSGKSNVVDALRFAFGELSLKALRAQNDCIAGLITNGAEKAEITVFLDGDKKYEIKRLIRGDGKSVYKLDGRHTTRTMVMDMLRPYGLDEGRHNVIPQGQVQRFIDMNAKERREIIDQVAGISDFEEKKSESLKELDKVEAKVNDAGIVLKEREGYLTELEKEKNDALKYIEARDSLRVQKGSLIHSELARVDAEHTKVSEKYLELKAKEDEVRNATAELEAKIAELEARKAKAVTSINEKTEREKTGIGKEVQDLQTSINVAVATVKEKEKELERVKSRAKALDDEKEEVGTRMKKFGSDADALKAQAAELEKSISAISGEKDSVSKGAEELGKHHTGLKKRAAELAKTLETKRNEKRDAELEADKARMRRESLSADIEKLSSGALSTWEARRKELDADAKAASQELASLEGEIERLFSQEKELNRKSPEVDRKLLSAKEQYASIAAKLAAVKDSPEQQALTSVLDLRDRGLLKGVHGTVGELCKFPADLSVAVEASAGQRFNYVIVDDVDTAAKAIDYLKQRKVGRCTFIPLDKKPFTLSEEARQLAKKEGSNGFVIDLVEFPPMLAPAYHYVFGDTLLVDSINAGKRIGIGRIRMVTREGDLMESSGVLTGGTFMRKGPSLRERGEAEKLHAEAEKLHAEREGIIQSLLSVREEMSRKRKERGELEVKVKSIEIELRHLAESDEKAKQEREAGAKRIAEIRAQIGDADSALQKHGLVLARLEAEISSLEPQSSALQTELESGKEGELKTKMDAAERKISGFIGAKSALETKIAGIGAEIGVLKQRISSIADEQSSLKKDAGATKAEVAALEKQAAEENKLLAEKMEALKSVSGALEKLYAERNSLDDQIGELAKEKGRKSHGFERYVKNLADMEAQKTILETRLADLKAEFANYADVKPIEGKKEDLEAKIHELELALASLGNVNLKAPEIYVEKKKDIEDIRVRIARLVEEKLAIMHMIDEIDTKKKDIFMETFHKLNENFKTLYSRIFKGESTFVLEDPMNPFASGLRIKAKDERKADKYLESMSGGEKALMALLFVFSIQMYRPAPFYILDEADAPLDKENSHKLANLLGQLAKGTQSQFIVVTHNDVVLSDADVALGVTKTAEGSRIVGIRLQPRGGNGGEGEKAVVQSVAKPKKAGA